MGNCMGKGSRKVVNPIAGVFVSQQKMEGEDEDVEDFSEVNHL